MTSHRPAVLGMSLGFVVACGGEIDGQDAVKDVPAEGPIDPASPDVLPTGMYTSRVIAASCNVNDAYRRGDRMLVIRARTLANLPLPIPLPPEHASNMRSAPRQDSDLGRTTMASWTKTDDPVCPGGTIVISVTLKELTANRLAFEYREEPRDCAQSSCSIDVALELDERACPPMTDPSCVPGPKKWAFARNSWQEVECQCASP
jgi:hypothetical protein